MNGGGTLLDAGNDRWRGPGGQDIAGTGVIVRHAYDAQDNGNAKLLISNLNWDARRLAAVLRWGRRDLPIS